MFETLWQILESNYAMLGDYARSLLILNIVLLVFSRPLVRWLDRFSADQGSGNKLHFFRVSNLLILVFILFYHFFIPHLDKSWITRILGGVVVIYIAYLLGHLLGYFVKRRFGRRREHDGKQLVTETYRSRLIGLLVNVLVSVVVLIAIIRIFGFDSLLEAGGVIGFIGVLLALTQGAWAPDIISGLVILNGEIVGEGDMIEFEDSSGNRVLGTVYRTKVFHTEILDPVNNHRIMLQNSRLRGMTIHNLSKFASARGLRESISFNVGYAVPASRIREMIAGAFRQLQESGVRSLEYQHEPEVRATKAADYAIEWTLYYYTKDLKNLLKTRQEVNLAVIESAAGQGISLATPVILLSQNTVTA